jgi:hypothetical protein
MNRSSWFERLSPREEEKPPRQDLDSNSQYHFSSKKRDVRGEDDHGIAAVDMINHHCERNQLVLAPTEFISHILKKTKMRGPVELHLMLPDEGDIATTTETFRRILSSSGLHRESSSSSSVSDSPSRHHHLRSLSLLVTIFFADDRRRSCSPPETVSKGKSFNDTTSLSYVMSVYLMLLWALS